MKRYLFITGSLLSAVFTAAAPAQPADSIAHHRELDEITVSANRQVDVKMRVPQQVFTLPAERIAQANAPTSADLLVHDGMLTVQKSQQGGGSPMIRGFESSRVLLVVDGVRLNNLIYRSGHLQNVISVDPGMLERAEVLYGPSSVNYGSDALGGVLSFTTRQPELAGDDRPDVFAGNAFMRYASVNRETTGHVHFNIGGQRFASLTSLSYSDFGDLRSGSHRNPFMHDDAYIHRRYEVVRQNGQDLLINNGDACRQPGSGYRQYDLLQKFLFKPGDRFSHTLNFQLSNTGNVPRYDRLTDLKGDLPKFAEWYYGPQFRLLAAYHLEATDWLSADKVNMTLAYQNVKESRHNRKFGDAWLGSRYENVNVVTLSTDWLKRLGHHQVHAGVDGALNFLASTARRTHVDTGERRTLDTRYPDGPNRMHNLDVYVSHRWYITPELTFSDGVRLGYSTLYAGFKSEEFFPFLSRDVKEVHQNNLTYSLSAGLNYNPTETWKMALSLSTGYRVPNIDDVGKVFDSQPGMVVVPNPDLRPEKTLNADLNVTHLHSGRLLWETVVFGTYLFDAITLKPFQVNGNTEIEYDGEMSAVYANHNSRRAFVTGASTRVKVTLLRDFAADAALNWTYGDIIDGEDGIMPLDHISPLFGRVGLTYTSRDKRFFAECYSLFNGRKPLNRYNLNGEDNIGYATVKGASGEGLPAWFTLNLNASCRLTPRTTLQLGVENLLDTEYRTFASGINAPGRNFHVGLRTEF